MTRTAPVAVRAAIAAAEAGPEPGDLADAPLMRDWSVAAYPGQLDVRLHGRVEGHPTIDDSAVTTFPMLTVDAGDGETGWVHKAGRWYRVDLASYRPVGGGNLDEVLGENARVTNSEHDARRPPEHPTRPLPRASSEHPSRVRRGAGSAYPATARAVLSPAVRHGRPASSPSAALRPRHGNRGDRESPDRDFPRRRCGYAVFRRRDSRVPGSRMSKSSTRISGLVGGISVPGQRSKSRSLYGRHWKQWVGMACVRYRSLPEPTLAPSCLE
jgi:hypothetical protein